MALASITIIGAISALAATLFKDKEPRIKDVFEMERFSEQEIENSDALKIVRNDINTYLTGIDDVQFHNVLLDIMAKHRKPIGYFSSLKGRLVLNDGCVFLKDKERLGWKGIWRYLNNCDNSFGYGITFAMLLFLLYVAIDAEKSNNYFDNAFSILLAITMGIMLYDIILASVKFRKASENKIKDIEYKTLFETYAKEKIVKSSDIN